MEAGAPALERAPNGPRSSEGVALHVAAGVLPRDVVGCKVGHSTPQAVPCENIHAAMHTPSGSADKGMEHVGPGCCHVGSPDLDFLVVCVAIISLVSQKTACWTRSVQQEDRQATQKLCCARLCKPGAAQTISATSASPAQHGRHSNTERLAGKGGTCDGDLEAPRPRGPHRFRVADLRDPLQHPLLRACRQPP